MWNTQFIAYYTPYRFTLCTVVSSKERSPESLQLAVTRMQQLGSEHLGDLDTEAGPGASSAVGGRVSR